MSVKNICSRDFTDEKLPKIKILESLLYKGGNGCVIIFIISSKVYFIIARHKV